jgi:hypothetical protein
MKVIGLLSYINYIKHPKLQDLKPIKAKKLIILNGHKDSQVFLYFLIVVKHFKQEILQLLLLKM